MQNRSPISFTCFLLIVAFSFYSSIVGAKNNSEFDLLCKKFTLANQQYPNETLYLQLDKQSYWANDDLWFKAYLQTQTDSTNIYVELISPAGKILQKKMYLAIDGLAYGDFNLPDTTSSGVYQIRSYTNWMRNFDENSFFHKDIIIWNIRNKAIENNTEKFNLSKIDLQFFPEGGTFVSGIKNKLGFKAVDENGVGINVNGSIIDNQGIFVTTFNCLYKGMGSLIMVPELGKKYKAIVSIADQDIEVDLPEATEKGTVLSLETTLPDELRMTVIEPSQLQSQSEALYYIIGQTRGNIIFNQQIKLTDGYFGLKINKKNLPSGVLQITLFDSNLVPCCERLAFINHNDYVNIDIKPNKKTYQLREEANVELTSILRDSIPLVANLSISAFTTESQLKLEEFPNNILTQFLLNSDLEGRIEEPAFYFKDNSKRTLVALDNLMLTQGWRRFAWNQVINNELKPLEFEHQSSIVVKGTVSSKFLEKPLPNSSVTLIFDQQAYRTHQQATDSLGRFYFKDFYFFDETSVLIQTKKENGKKNTWLEVDESSVKSPEVTQKPINYSLTSEEKVSTTFQVSIKDSSLIQRKWHISDTILLDDIDIFGKTRKRELDNASTVFMSPDMSRKIAEDENPSANIFDYMMQNMPGLYIEDGAMGSGPTIRIGGNSGAALLLLDGFPVESDLLETLPFSNFEQIDVQRFAIMYGIKGNNGAINFTSRRGVKNEEVLLPSGVDRIKLKGYAVLREFYSPNYKDTKPSIEKTDFRSTLYWHPNIWTDKNGKNSVSYYNGDQPGEVNIVVEGFTSDGRLCRGTTSYKIEF